MLHGPEEKGRRKHTPVIEAPSGVKAGEWFDVKVIVGKDIPHPNAQEHWIESVELWADGFKLARAEFSAGKAASEVVFRVKLDATAKLTAYAYCNLHGLWQSEPVEVEVT